MKWFVYLMVAVGLCAEIRVADSLQPVAEALEQTTDETLTLLDVGGTLITANDAVLQEAHEEWKRAWFRKHVPGMTRKGAVMSIAIVRGDPAVWHSTDPEWLSILSKANGKVCALTKMTVDPILAGMTEARLREHGFIFQDWFPGLTGETFVYANGIIETEAKLKGPVLKEVLSKLEVLPKKILFVDDRMDQIESVHEACRDLGIECLAIHLTAFKNYAELDEKVADLQLHTLVAEKRWMPEAEARKILTNTSPILP